jgi:hypothetical protein
MIIPPELEQFIKDLPQALPTTAEKVSPMDLISPDQKKNVQKTQGIRLLDVFILGPVMVYSAMDRSPPKILRAFMMAVGVGTILYNASNYMEQQKTLETPKK